MAGKKAVPKKISPVDVIPRSLTIRSESEYIHVRYADIMTAYHFSDYIWITATYSAQPVRIDDMPVRVLRRIVSDIADQRGVYWQRINGRWVSTYESPRDWRRDAK